MGGGLPVFINDVTAVGLAGALGSEPLGLLWWGVVGMFGPLPPMAFLTSYALHTVVCDALEGRYTQREAAKPILDEKKQEAEHVDDLVAPDVQGSVTAPPGVAIGSMSLWQKIVLWVQIQSDSINLAELTIVSFG